MCDRVIFIFFILIVYIYIIYFFFLLVRFCERETTSALHGVYVWYFFQFSDPFSLCFLVQAFNLNQMQFQLLTLQTKWV